MSEALVVINHVSKIFPGEKIAALNDIQAEIPKGQIIALAGPDGAGKTTLIRLIVGLLLPTQGSIEVAGYNTSNQSEEIHNFTGYMPQKFGLYEDLTVMENLNLYADLKGVVGEESVPTVLPNYYTLLILSLLLIATLRRFQEA